jgi:predicted alpha/beta-fold hydrolase
VASGSDGPFRPIPLLGNPHLQTILGTFWRGRPFLRPSTRRLVELPDGDRLLISDSTPPGWPEGGPVAVLLHGMGGTRQSGYIQRLAGLLTQAGARVVRLDLRGNQFSLHLARRFYHAGLSADVRAVVEYLARLCPGSPVDLVGYSLSGNMVLKLAGEVADDPLPNLARVVAVAPPIDLARCAALLAEPRNRLYDRHFSRELAALARLRAHYHPDLPLTAFPQRLTVRLFDDLYTAPRWGFADAEDYYRQSSAAPLVPRIALPTLILTARDDPFIAVASFEELPCSPDVSVEVVPWGGHLGYLGWSSGRVVRWAEHRIAGWLSSFSSPLPQEERGDGQPQQLTNA